MFQIYYMLTNACNLRCSHCIRGEQENIVFMNLEDAIKGLDKIASWRKDIMLIISGGEPTLHANFDTILDYALGLFKKIVINTNGTTDFFTKFSEKYKDATNLLVQISVDGSEDFHDKIRGVGTFKRSVGLLDKLVKIGYKVSVSTTVNKRNIEAIQNLCLILNDLNIFKWHVSSEMPFGRADKANMLSSEEWNDLLTKLFSIARLRLTVRKLFNMNSVERLTDEEILRLSKNAICNCGTSKMKLYVYSDFRVRACTCIPDVVCGNLMENSIEDILQCEDMKRLRDIKIKSESPCSQCRYLLLCNGGCLGMSKHFFGDFGYGDIRCSKGREYYESKKNFLF